jgi:hypothetical protein
VFKQSLDKREHNEENKARLSTYKKYREVEVPEEFNAYRDRKIAAFIQKEKNARANADRQALYFEDPLGARSYGTVSPSEEATSLRQEFPFTTKELPYLPKITTTSLGGKKSRKRRLFRVSWRTLSK